MHTYHVSAMTCAHCVNAVTEEIMALDGVTDVQVDLVAGGISTVEVSGEVSDERVAAAIEEAGYALAEPRTVE